MDNIELTADMDKKNDELKAAMDKKTEQIELIKPSTLLAEGRKEEAELEFEEENGKSIF